MFRVGEKVVCVDDIPNQRHDDRIYPVKNQIYTVRAAYYINVGRHKGKCGYLLEEIINEKRNFLLEGYKEPGFLHFRFRRLVDQKKIEELLTTAPKEVENV